MDSMEKYWAIDRVIANILVAYDLCRNEKFIHECVRRVMEDADDAWNEDDCKIAIRNVLNELIEKNF